MLQHFIKENEASRRELGEFIAQLGDAKLEQEVGNGWTVSTMLCHVAFWEQRALYLLRQWRGGQFETFRLTAQTIHSINEAGRVIARAVPGRAAAQIALRSAEETDSEVLQISEDLAKTICAAGLDRMLNRSLHRREHLQKLKEKLQLI
jgi:hypothetical protein